MPDHSVTLRDYRLEISKWMKITEYIFTENPDLEGASLISMDFLDIPDLLNFSSDKHVVHYVASQNSHLEALILIPKGELTKNSIEVSEDFLESFFSKHDWETNIENKWVRSNSLENLGFVISSESKELGLIIFCIPISSIIFLERNERQVA